MTTHSSILRRISEYLSTQQGKEKRDYYVPSLWMGNDGPSAPVKVNPVSFFKNTIDGILQQSRPQTDYSLSLSTVRGQKHGDRGGDWTYTSRFYNIFPRQTAAYDHDNDGHVGDYEGDITLSRNGFRETGTFLKCIAMLPYLKGLGIDVVYCLPLTTIGKDGNRGDLGSPYAIRNPYKLDELLADPLVPFTVDEQFQAFVEAAHILGMRVIMEFVLRTSSLDGDWIKEHPEWFYWIDRKRAAEYHSPEFTQDELSVIKQIPDGGMGFIPPHDDFRSLFKSPPKPSEIKVEDGKYVAYTKEGQLIIPGAFADWPPDDIQPAWSDVTYLRMYDYPIKAGSNDFNYIAYNTIRYYDPGLARPEYANQPLWDKLIGVIPHYQEEFGIDGVMMDMGHALPKPLMERIISRAREVDADFAFCEENFDVTWKSREAGYNAVLGHEWRVSARKDGMGHVVWEATGKLPLPIYGTPETHNTPRAVQRGGVPNSKLSWVLNSFLPNCIPFIHQGFELAEDFPVNTGLNFLEHESEYFRNQRLPLFFKSALRWNNQYHLVPFIKKVNSIRDAYKHFVATGNELSMRQLGVHGGFDHIVAFERFDPWHPQDSLLVVGNMNFEHSEHFYLGVEGTHNNSYVDLLGGGSYQFVDGWMSTRLEPGECLVLKLHKHLW